ncbi:LicD family protein [Clostridium botulinum]|nr:LicD family protein [Clostridium botulinum]
MEKIKEQRLLSLDEIQKIEFNILKKFANVCEENNLRYYLCGGTLLGAIRHKGFIPWDDDIDILMPRPDFIKFQELSKKFVMGNDLKVCSSYLGNLNDPFCKIFNVKTIMEKEYAQDNFDNHIWIDIFPMDGLPMSEKKVKRIFSKVAIARAAIRTIKVKIEISDKISKTKGKAVMKKILQPIFRLIGCKPIVKYIDNLSQKYNFDDSFYVGGIAFGYGIQEKMVKKEYIQAIKVEFEGELFNAPRCWNTYLKNLYGDYMQLPPKEQQVAHVMKAWVKK